MKKNFSASDFSPQQIAAFCWILLPFLHLPLAFARLGGARVPYFGVVPGANLAVLGVFSLAIVLAFPSRYLAALKESPCQRYLAAAAGLLLLTAAGQQIVFQDSREHWETALFFAAAPAAATALAPELRKLLPKAAAAGAVLLAASGVMSGHFTGLTGNWNWTQTLLMALLPGLCLVIKRRRIATAIAAIAVLLLLRIFYPDEWSRAAAAGTAMAILLSIVFLKIISARSAKKEGCEATGRTGTLPGAGGMEGGETPPISRRMHHIRFKLAILLFFIGAAAFLFFVSRIGDVNDSRIQLWRGGLNCALETPLTGSGPLRFADRIGGVLPEQYFFTAHPATHHPHPHNELLNFWNGYGIAGIIYLAVLFTAALGHARPKRDALALWSFLVIFTAGQFDMAASIPLGAWWMVVPAALCASPLLPAEPGRTPLPLALCAALLVFAGLGETALNLRSGNALRQAKIALLRRDFAAAAESCDRSAAIRLNPEALYLRAEIALHADRDPAAALALLRRIDGELKLHHYLHTHRLRAIALFQSGHADEAETELRTELACFPASLVAAHLLYQLELRKGLVTPETRKRFLTLCRLRGVAPPAAANYPADRDDAPFPQEKNQ